MACGQPPSQREGGSVWQIFTLEQLKSHSWNIAKETAHPSVGRSLSAGHHRLILPLYRLRLNAPPQDRLHRSNVTMLARAKPNIPHREPLRTIHTVCHLSCVPPVNGLQSRLARLASLYQSTLANRLGWSANSPRHIENETPARPLPHYGKIRETEFSNGDFVFSPTL